MTDLQPELTEAKSPSGTDEKIAPAFKPGLNGDTVALIPEGCDSESVSVVPNNHPSSIIQKSFAYLCTHCGAFCHEPAAPGGKFLRVQARDHAIADMLKLEQKPCMCSICARDFGSDNAPPVARERKDAQDGRLSLPPGDR